ncbi:copper transporter [Phosphitispora fastidiosa]|uniref:copper transporter n=1 Tax=Phosphitispora fastidiosa TaxID=2837202 RepID=UPI001E46EEDA|nr:copper transporter [Phosphitispora fastidiosa]MBU7007676.1 outer membrane murein-binding lipoprotein Lpp [Phosphitispora fastidiosa]
MIIDFKYHVASLVAVFLALGIGILVGSSFLGENVNEAIIQQQKQIVSNLNRDFEQMRQDHKVAQEEIEAYKSDLNISKQFEEQVLPTLFSGKLAEKQIAVIETNSYGFHDDWIENLGITGANVVSITAVLDGFDLSQEEIRNSIKTKLMLKDDSEGAVSQELAREIAEGIISAQNLENLHYFEQLGLIKNSGDYGVPIDAVIFVGGSQEEVGQRCANLDIPMMNYFLERNIPVFGVETSDVAYSYMKEYQKLKVSTVDNIDMIPGQLSLVMSVYGKPGNYGIKTTARQLMPEVQ